MLSSLVPGSIFSTSGLNRKSTPTPPTITPSELDYRYRRESFNGTEPHDSPVSRAYDVSNSSTSLILLNNKYGKGSTRLRGYYTGPSSTERFIDPNRHRGKSPRNPDHHYRCLDSSTPKFEPNINTGLEWTNMSQRPPSSLIARSLVNPNRHQSCRSTRITRSSSPTSDRPQSRMSLPPAKYFSEFSDMTVGETLYMWSIEKIYNVENLKQLKQEQYRKLLQLEAKKGYHGYADYAKYLRYINNAPNRTYGTQTGTPRSKSAVSNRSNGATSPTKGTESRAENDADKDDSNDKSEESEVQKRPQTSAPTTRQEDKKDTKPAKQEIKYPPPKLKEEKNLKVLDTNTRGQESRSSSRSSRHSQQKLGSLKSLRSKGSSKPSSRASSAKSVQSNSRKVESHEGTDRPKSRAGRPTDDGSSKSKGVDVKKTDNVEPTKDEKADSFSTNSSRSSLAEKNKLGSTTSLSSRNSSITSYSENTKTPVKTSTSDNTESKEVKVHRIPSAVELKDATKEDNTANQDTKTTQPEDKDDDKQTKETEKSVKFSDVKSDAENKTDEAKHDRNDDSGTVNKSDVMKESGGPLTDDSKQDKTRNKLSRQDSFDEDDDERRANKDLDKIEY